jgi:hypothetical protein
MYPANQLDMPGKLIPLNGPHADMFEMIIRPPGIEAPPLIRDAGFETK